jgi:EamA domain-containing membrane protein RarD
MHFITAFNKVATQTRPIISIQFCLLWFFYFHTARIYQIKGIKSGPFEIHLSFSLSFDILVFVMRQKKRKLFLKEHMTTLFHLLLAIELQRMTILGIMPAL